MDGRLLTKTELLSHKPGEALTITAVMAVLVIAVMAVVVYRLLKSDNGSVKVPGGWSFNWK